MRSMRNAGGFVKVYRSIMEWEWYTDVPTRVLFDHLLVAVNWSVGRWMGIDILPGSIVTSYGKLAADTGLTEKQVRRAAENLKSTGEITAQKAGRGQLISIAGWDLYQGDEETGAGKRQTKGRVRAASGQAKGTERATIEEGKKGRREEEETALPFLSDQFVAAWATWEASRREAHKPIGPTARRLQLKKCSEWGEARAITALIHSAEGGYQGLFEPRADSQQRTPTVHKLPEATGWITDKKTA